MPREDSYTNYPEDAGEYDRRFFGEEYEDDKPTLAELEADEESEN